MLLFCSSLRLWVRKSIKYCLLTSLPFLSLFVFRFLQNQFQLLMCIRQLVTIVFHILVKQKQTSISFLKYKCGTSLREIFLNLRLLTDVTLYTHFPVIAIRKENHLSDYTKRLQIQMFGETCTSSRSSSFVWNTCEFLCWVFEFSSTSSSSDSRSFLYLECGSWKGISMFLLLENVVLLWNVVLLLEILLNFH